MGKQIQPGEMITAYGVRGLDNLTTGKQYKCVNGTEPGIFETRPFVTVIDDNGNEYACHQSRFEKLV
ncbi:hypothetical protein [Vibrio phage vB_VpaS_SD15]|nr:hypothetical protein [Vibrio phage vB_VpaS_SD15]